MGIFKAKPLRVTERKRTDLSTYRILTAPVGAVMKGQLKTLAANTVQGCGSVCVCVCLFVSVYIYLSLCS